MVIRGVELVLLIDLGDMLVIMYLYDIDQRVEQADSVDRRA